MKTGHEHLAINEVYREIASGNLKRIQESFSGDVIWSSHSDEPSVKGTQKGIHSIESYFKSMAGTQIKNADIHTVIENGNRKIALVFITLQKEINGHAQVANFVHVLRFTNGKITRMDVYSNPAIS
jgi:ketosteroid isomerase-like protein